MATLIDVGASHVNSTVPAIPIADTTVDTPYGTLLSLFGLAVEFPTIFYNYVLLNGSIGVSSSDASLSPVTITITRRNTSIPGDPEVVVWQSTSLGLTPVLNTALGASQLLTFSAVDGGVNNKIPTGYYAYALYVSAPVLLDILQPFVIGPYGISGTSFRK